PSAIAVHDDGGVQLLLPAESTLHHKARCQNKEGSGRLQAGRAERGRAGPRGTGSIAHHLLEHFQIVEVALAAFGRDPTDGLRPILVIALLDRDQAGLLEHREMPAEIAVVQPATLLPLTEPQPLL